MEFGRSHNAGGAGNLPQLSGPLKVSEPADVIQLSRHDVASVMQESSSSEEAVLERVLSWQRSVRPGEARNCSLLAVNVFVLLSGYYTIRPLRSALLLPVQIRTPGVGSWTGSEISRIRCDSRGAVLVIVPDLQRAVRAGSIACD
jgi:hypothetical protein